MVTFFSSILEVPQKFWHYQLGDGSRWEQ